MRRDPPIRSSPLDAVAQRRFPIGIGLLIGGFVLGLFGLWYGSQRRAAPPDPAATLAAAEAALHIGHLEEAERFVAPLIQGKQVLPGARIVTARIAGERFDWSNAVSACEGLTETERRAAARQLFRIGEAAVREGRVRQAESCLRLALHLNPSDLEALHILAFVLGAEGRAWEAYPYVQALIEHGRYGPPQLLLVGAVDQFFINNRQFVELALVTRPDDPLPRLALARNALVDNRSSEAATELLQVLRREPVPLEAMVRWGRLLFDKETFLDLYDWEQALPPEADSHPEIWVTRGLFALRKDESAAAVRCFAHAARLDPNHLTAHLQLGRLLPSFGDHEVARAFQERAAGLAELQTPLTTFRSGIDPALVRRVAELCERLGRPREAQAWAEWALRTQAETDWAAAVVQRMQQRYAGSTPWILDEARLAWRIPLETLPLPSSERIRIPASPQSSGTNPSTPVTWSEDAASLGIRFQYHNDAASPENTLRMPEFTGGGLAVLDYDRDGRPDLYAAQGAELGPRASATRWLDRLYRQRDDSGFEDVTDASGLFEPGYSQGVAVGDFDQDGFPDLYIGNFGPNRLFRNNGDGTWSQWTAAAGIADRDWTTSCAWADLNGDALPDLFVVKYLAGEDLLTRVCGTAEHPHACLPTQFAPQQDRLWINLGDGRFEDQTESALLKEQGTGRGLGVLVTALDNPARPSVLVANDTDPNFWYVNESAAGGPFRFREEGLLAGVAVDHEGHAQACMGIAAGDIDRDGLLDFFLTNFYRESNVLYRQTVPGTFQDETQAAGLREPSLLMLGFGAQFLDAENDGWLDLVVTNGHVYNNAHLDEPYRMRPQVFRNRGLGKFKEAPTGSTGDYFSGTYLGRALVRWDWNRDGLPDIAISHLDAPLAVLTNRSPTPHQALVLHLVGVASNRDAVGAVVRVRAGATEWHATVTAGDGYLASNEKLVHIGVGSTQILDEVEVRWPSGRVQLFAKVTTDHAWLAVEGRSLVTLHGIQRGSGNETVR